MLESLATKRGKPTVKLEIMAELLREYFQQCEHHWVFTCDDNDVILPYFVSTIRYHPRDDRREAPAYVEFEAQAYCRGEIVSIQRHWQRSALGGPLGLTVEALLENEGFVRETPELVDSWTQDAEKYHSVRDKLGHMFVATGGGVSFGDDFDQQERRSRYNREDNVKFDGSGGNRVVMNDTFKEGKHTAVTCSLWSKDASDVEQSVKLPLHPFVVVFDLTLHEFVRVHVKQITAYRYDKTAEGKLVLSDDRKELIDMLVRASQERSEDIVKGKSGGVIMLLSGPPGVGKTLSAEVYSEFVKRPLYTVQCSQLGITANKLEEELQIVLNRAMQWKAVLLIDEADVYIRSRGDDINQNAIVGVLLRVLEHYSGVLFMTTNRATVVDDAIMSRMIAHIKYELPDEDESVKLWKVLSTQYGVELSESEIAAAVAYFKQTSGRSIKNMLRLSKVLAAARKTEVNLSILKHVAKFQEAM
jgi:hypothetical protein